MPVNFLRVLSCDPKFQEEIDLIIIRTMADSDCITFSSFLEVCTDYANTV